MLFICDVLCHIFYVLLTVARDGENIAAIVTFLYLYVSGCFKKKMRIEMIYFHILLYCCKMKNSLALIIQNVPDKIKWLEIQKFFFGPK